MASTDTRQLRLLIKDILKSKGIDNLEAEMLLADGVRRFFIDVDKGRTAAEARASIAATLEASAKDLTKWDDFITWLAAEWRREIGTTPPWHKREWEELARHIQRRGEDEWRNFVRWFKTNNPFFVKSPPSRPEWYGQMWTMANPPEERTSAGIAAERSKYTGGEYGEFVEH